MVWTKGIEAKERTMCGWTWLMETTSTKSRRMLSWHFAEARHASPRVVKMTPVNSRRNEKVSELGGGQTHIDLS